MAEAAIAFLLQSLKDFLFSTIQLSKDAKSVLESLQTDLQKIKDELEKAGEKKSGQGFTDLESKILGVIYEAEDLIDLYFTQSRGTTSKGEIDLISKVKELRQGKLKTTLEEAKRKIKELPVPDAAFGDDLQKRKNYKPSEKKAVGIEASVKSYVDVLVKQNRGVDLVSMIGDPGSGKTTVAATAFTHNSVCREFPTRIWMNVSQVHNKREIYLAIIKVFTERDMSTLTDLELTEKTRDLLLQVKFLLVFDDVWSVEAWEDVKQAVPMNGGLGKVLVTTRFDKVAKHVNQSRGNEKLTLKDGESWKLLQFQVYGSEKKWPPELKVHGDKICEKSRGSALAIVVLGGILKDIPEDKREAEWKKIAESAEKYVAKANEVWNNVIGLSYDKLPYYLRDCFLYMGICPKDYEVSTRKLKNLWIAEGFIQPEENSDKTLEDIAEEYLLELIKRNLVLAGKRNVRGDVKTCRIPDAIREFCLEKTKSIMAVITKSNTGKFVPEVSELTKYRRICVHSHDVLDFFKGKLDGPHLRTFISFSKTPNDAEATALPSVAQAFKLLRIFEASSIKFPQFEPKFADLNHLRYTTLAAGENLKSLPANIANLLHLQTLVIVSPHEELEIKFDIAEMPRLRHVKSKSTLIFTPSNVKTDEVKNKDLQTLSRLSTKNCTKELLSKVTSLQTLVISGDFSSLGPDVSFAENSLLKKLKLFHVVPTKTPAISLNLPSLIEVLVLSATYLPWSYMSTLGQLANLQILKIKDNAFVGQEWTVVSGEFLKLIYLEIEGSELSSWKVADGAFGNVECLSARNCPSFPAIPNGVASSRAFKRVHMGKVPKDALVSGVEMKKRGVTLIVDPGTEIPVIPRRY